MLNILIPLAGDSIFFDSEKYIYPKPIIEINGKMMIQHVIENLEMIKGEKKYIFIVKEKDCKKHHLDHILKLLTNNNCEIIVLGKETKGAICSALMAIEYIDNENPLIITNSDQIINEDLSKIVNTFSKRNKEASVLTFRSVHPRWSFVRLGENDEVVEASEKKPISNHAIAGFYFFSKGNDFVNAAMKTLKKNMSIDGKFYISPCLNELILENKRVSFLEINEENYHTFYSPQKIQEFEQNKPSFQKKPISIRENGIEILLGGELND